MRKRLDVLVYERGLAESRERAKSLIAAGGVFVDGIRAGKPSRLFSEGAEITVGFEAMPYVGRGGLKLEKAIGEFSIDLRGLTCADIGASTGGFTDCMLQNGAKAVYAVDVGSSQLHRKLREDPRVINLENTNARDLDRSIIDAEIEFFAVDVSFISLTLLLPAIRGILSPRGRGVCLIKPQFEAGRDKVGKNGVVRDENARTEVIERITQFSLKNGFSVLGLTFSPIKGQKGNIEYLLYLKLSGEPAIEKDVPSAREVVELSRLAFEGKKEER